MPDMGFPVRKICNQFLLSFLGNKKIDLPFILQYEVNPNEKTTESFRWSY